MQTNLILQRLQTLRTYINAHINDFNLDEIREKLCYTIDYQCLKNDEYIKKSWKDFTNDFLTDSKNCLACLGLIVHQMIIESLQELGNGDYVYEDDIPMINARLHNYKPIVKIKNLKVEDYSKMVTVHGTIIKSGPQSLATKQIAFKCGKCDGCQVVEQHYSKYITPRNCLNTGCKKTSDFIPLLTSVHTITYEQQIIKIQDFFEDDETINGNSVPKSIKCILTKDLVNCCTPGDDVIVTGVLQVCFVGCYNFGACTYLLSSVTGRRQYFR